MNFDLCRVKYWSNRYNIEKASGTHGVLRLCKVTDLCSQACRKNVGDRQTDTQTDRQTHRHTDTQTDTTDFIIVAPFERGNYNDVDTV